MATKPFEVSEFEEGRFSASAFPKLNIVLKISKKGMDNMHRINSVMQTVGKPADLLLLEIVKPRKSDMSKYPLGVGHDDILHKAYVELSKEAGYPLPCRLSLNKKIPLASGLGGGSSDAAAFLRLANHAFNLHMNMRDLHRIAIRIGSDVPFLLRGGRAHVVGSSHQEIEKEYYPPSPFYLIANPNRMLGTKMMYDLYDINYEKISRWHTNDFTDIACMMCKQTKKLLAVLAKGSIEYGLTGKGPTVFAGYKTREECENAEQKLHMYKWFDGNTFIAEPTQPFMDY